jgi:hypothetical protein
LNTRHVFKNSFGSRASPLVATANKKKVHGFAFLTKHKVNAKVGQATNINFGGTP